MAAQTRARLADIAAQAQVSQATVSRVLNDRPGASASTRQAVLTALDVLGYERPGHLHRTGAGLVGLILPELDNPIFPAFAQIAESTLAQQGYTSMLCTQTPGTVSEDEYVDMMRERDVAGIVFMSGMHAAADGDPGRYHRLTTDGVPFVLVNGFLPGVAAPFVSCDEHGAAELAVAHLASLGHRRIGLVCGPRRYTPTRRKVAGYQAAMAGLYDGDLEELIEIAPFGVEGGHGAALRLLERGVTAMLCGSDLMALGAIRAVRANGLSVPGDVSVVGFDDSLLMAYTDPPLTTLRQPVRAMAQAAVRALLDEIGGYAAPHSEYMFRPELVVRGSTAALR
ncbi:HTH-type transcriptional regulator MalR [Catellatospora methionotrophica]|uniref:HTH-type transcriptional regulator MalR n=2 Tax=Catellatospora methionotrophica TaxID=121620 RepID=A0A8J3LM68_9ACTN|nr:LacI family DNA-binding transcriptional regulator [Catellatospora methionotrophica]GIG18129.1 HTH-type transcriptional regulator MalR [Catellatospora methionotrophica]